LPVFFLLSDAVLSSSHNSSVGEKIMIFMTFF
jgi:hypothetical protein